MIWAARKQITAQEAGAQKHSQKLMFFWTLPETSRPPAYIYMYIYIYIFLPYFPSSIPPSSPSPIPARLKQKPLPQNPSLPPSLLPSLRPSLLHVRAVVVLDRVTLQGNRPPPVAPPLLLRLLVPEILPSDRHQLLACLGPVPAAPEGPGVCGRQGEENEGGRQDIDRKGRRISPMPSSTSSPPSLPTFLPPSLPPACPPMNCP